MNQHAITTATRDRVGQSGSCLLTLLACMLALSWGTRPASAQSEAQLVADYVNQWSGLQRARWVTYRYDHPVSGVNDFMQGGYVSDVPREFSKNLNPDSFGPNRPVDPFDGSPKHVVVMVHGYGAPPGLNGFFQDLNEPFYTVDHPAPFIHESGATAWFDNGQAYLMGVGPNGTNPAAHEIPLKLYSFLRDRPAEYGFDPSEWVVLATTMNILPSVGFGLSIIENRDRFLALMDLLWDLKGDEILTISIVSHSTGSVIVKSAIGERNNSSAQASYLAEHPWIQYIDDHINLAGALGGTPSVMVDNIAMTRPIGHQLLYGIQNPLDYQYSGDCYLADESGGLCLISYRYTGYLTVLDSTVRKKSASWPDHVNVLSVAGVWNVPTPGTLQAPVTLANVGQPFDGNPFSESGNGLIALITDNFIDSQILCGKSDGVVPSRSVIEHIRYRMDPAPPGAGWIFQNSEHVPIKYDGNWTIPTGHQFGNLLALDGGGWFGSSAGVFATPTSNTNPNEMTYVEIEAHHNGMLHNQNLSRLIKRWLGDITIVPNGPLGVVWVDFNYSGQIQNGTQSFPFATLDDALQDAAPGSTIRIVTGNSPETLTINQPHTVEAVGGEVTIGQ